MTNMFAPNRFALLVLAALAVLATAPVAAQAKDAATTAVAASSQTTTARAAYATPKIKQHRKTASRYAKRQMAAVQAPSGPHCFLLWCSSRPIAAPWLVLGVAY